MSKSVGTESGQRVRNATTVTQMTETGAALHALRRQDSFAQEGLSRVPMFAIQPPAATGITRLLQETHVSNATSTVTDAQALGLLTAIPALHQLLLLRSKIVVFSANHVILLQEWL